MVTQEISSPLVLRAPTAYAAQSLPFRPIGISGAETKAPVLEFGLEFEHEGDEIMLLPRILPPVSLRGFMLKVDVSWFPFIVHVPRLGY